MLGVGIGIQFINKAGGGGVAPNPNFVSTWDTTKAGSASDTIVLPLIATGTYSGTIDWGDTSTSVLSYANRSHTYTTSGTYTITISGTIEGFNFTGTSDYRKITDISNWGTLVLTAGISHFSSCSNLDVSATDAPTITTTTLKNLFRSCTSLTTPDFTNWDVSGVTIMEGVFHGCTNFNGDVSNWDVSNVISFGVQNYGIVSAMFYGCTVFNGDITGWDTSSAILFYNMFVLASSFNQDISNWNTANVTNFYQMFYGASSFNQSLSSWDVTSATTMYSMFSNASSFNSPLNWTSLGSVTDLTDMFAFSQFNQDISGWDVSNVKKFGGMFRSTPFNKDLSSWNMSNALILGFNSYGASVGMFTSASSYDQDMSSWDINQVTNFYQFCLGVTLSTANYDALLIAWDAQGAMSYSGTVNFGGSQYSCKAETARTSLISKWGGIADGGLNASINCNFVSIWDTTNAGSASDTIVLPMTAGNTVHWGDGSSDTTNTHTYASGGVYTVTIEGAVNTFRFAGAGDRLKILDVSNWGTFDIANDRTFQNCSNLDVTATDVPILSSSNSASSLFQACNLIYVDFSTWDFSVCTNFRLFLNRNYNFTGNVEGIIQSGVLRIDQGFNLTPLGNPDLSTWDVSGVTIWQDALRSCQLGALTDVSGWVPQGNMNGAFLINPDFEGLGLDTWTIGAITNGINLFANCTLTTANYNAALIAWEAQAPTNAVPINFGSSQYTLGGAAEAARTSLITTYGWTITDGGGI